MSVGSVRVRTRQSAGSVFLDLRFSHPMESGKRTDGMGKAIPSWYLTHVEVFHADERIASMELGPLVSRNPAISLQLDRGGEGDTIKVTWIDNRGLVGEQETEVQ